ncbi:hypothetical protein D9M72_400470 [compost metagenome]
MQCGFLCLHRAHGDTVLAEDFDGTGHLADFVLAGDIGTVAVELAVGEFAHGGSEFAHRHDDTATGNDEADADAEEHTGCSGGGQDGHCDRGRLEGFGARGGERVAGIGAVGLDRRRYRFLGFERLVERSLDDGSIRALAGSNGDHCPDFVEVAVEGDADVVQQLVFGIIGNRLDLRQTAEHFLGTLFGFLAKVGGLLRRCGKLIGHAADGDDIDAQIHRLARRFLACADVDDRRAERGKTARTGNRDQNGGYAHDHDHKADLGQYR